jgi:hypothetical protein
MRCAHRRIGRLALAAAMTTAVGLGGSSAASAAEGIFEYSGNSPSTTGYTKFAAAAGEPLTRSATMPASLSQYRCAVLPVNRATFSSAQLDTFDAYVDGGGTLIAVAEWDGFAGAANPNMNAVANRLGSGLDVVNAAVDSGFQTTTNIEPTPWTNGVDSLWYALTSAVPVTAGSSAQTLARTRTTALSTSKTPFLGVQEIGEGVFVLAGDSNLFTDATPYDTNDNARLAANLCGPDVTPPKIALHTPPDGAQYTLGESVQADYECRDSQSAVSTCRGPVPSGAAIDTTSVGSKSFTVDAASEGGPSSKAHAYSVVWETSEFSAPLNGKDADGNYVLNKMKAGGAVPVKFSLGGDRGLDIFADGYPKSEAIACDSTADVDGIEETVATGNSGLHYDATADQYTYVWKTDKAWADSCRQIVLKLADGTYHRANFKFAR